MSLSLRSTPARLLVGLVVVGVLSAIGWYTYEAVRPAEVNLIRPSYGFDVSDRQQLAGHADNVFIGRVTEISGVDDADKGPHTIFSVAVEENLKGGLQGTVLVRQLGAKIGKDVWQVEHDMPLTVGSVYVLATSNSQKQKGAQSLLAGQVSHESVNTVTERQSVVADWRDAIQHQRQPDTLAK